MVVKQLGAGSVIIAHVGRPPVQCYYYKSWSTFDLPTLGFAEPSPQQFHVFPSVLGIAGFTAICMVCKHKSGVCVVMWRGCVVYMTQRTL